MVLTLWESNMARKCPIRRVSTTGTIIHGFMVDFPARKGLDDAGGYSNNSDSGDDSTMMIL